MKSSKYNIAIDPGGKEGLMGQRLPSSSKRLFIFWIRNIFLVFALLAIVKPLNGKPINGKLRCRHNEVTVGQCDSRSCTCITCPTCPPGQGLLPLCGTSVSKNEEIQCVPCKSGTFSAENSTQSCQPCHQCDGQKTLRNCTSTQNTECSVECMDGYLKDTITERCEKVIVPPPRITILKPFQPPTRNTVQSTTTSDSTKSKEKVVESNQIATNEKSGVQTKEPVDEKKIFQISISTLAAMVFLAVVVFILNKQRKNLIKLIWCLRQSQDKSDDLEASMPMNSIGNDTSNHLEGVRLKDISPNLKKKIIDKISKKSMKGWEEIGNKYEISNDELEGIRTKCSWGQGILPGTFVLEILSAHMPHLTLKEFVEVLKSLKRKDVIGDIKEEYNQLC